MLFIQTVRGSRLAYGTEGTVYGFDGTTDSYNIQKYQRRLAALLALSEPSGTKCNPYLVAQYRGDKAL